MSHPISEDDLHAYIDGALPPVRRAEVDAYLEDNPDIARRFGRLAAHRDGLRAALGPIAAEPVPPQLNLEYLAAPRRRMAWTGWRAASAAGLLLLAGGAGGWTLRGIGADRNIGIEALAEEASYTYAVFGPDRNRAVEITAADSSALMRWMENRLHRPVALPDLNGTGFRLMGGRVVATQNGPAGLLLYDDTGGRRIAMLMRPMIKRDQNARMRQHHQGDVVGFSWADRGMGYSLVGDMSATLLHPVADEARRQLRSKVRA